MQLEHYSAELSAIADKLMQHNCLQERLILFRQCFCAKPIHLFRTLSANQLCDT